MTVHDLIERLTCQVLDSEMADDQTEIQVYLDGDISGIVAIDRVEFRDESGVLYPLIITRRITEAK